MTYHANHGLNLIWKPTRGYTIDNWADLSSDETRKLKREIRFRRSRDTLQRMLAWSCGISSPKRVLHMCTTATLTAYLSIQWDDGTWSSVSTRHDWADYQLKANTTISKYGDVRTTVSAKSNVQKVCVKTPCGLQTMMCVKPNGRDYAVLSPQESWISQLQRQYANTLIVFTIRGLSYRMVRSSHA